MKVGPWIRLFLEWQIFAKGGKFYKCDPLYIEIVFNAVRKTRILQCNKVLCQVELGSEEGCV